ncbi:NAD(P)H-binding protein [Polaribacter sp. R77954]|uniref:NAD(P)H-binding protein n=1 Tax=Polaribacter sp. R77954 TaxID=3093870 RepID=UPI0037CA7CBB
MGKTAIILGATGLTGGILLRKLIDDENYSTIKLFSRRTVGIKSSKIKEYLIDVLALKQSAKDFTADEVFCCIGTTTAKTKDKKLYKAIDYGIPVTASKLAKQHNIATFIVMSSMGADAKSAVFYNRTKGEMERDVLKQSIPNTYILRPSLIGGNRNENRVGERIGKAIMRIINPIMIGNLKKYKMIYPEKIANCMHFLANTNTNTNTNTTILTSDEIQEISNSITS